MRIAFVGHSYHRKTGSSDFLLALLRRMGEVETFYDESWLSGADSGWAADLRPDEFDCVVVFQAPEPILRLDRRHPNLVFVPMLDGHLGDGRFWWREELSAAKIVCFSATLDRELAALAPLRFFAQYFPPVDGLPALARPDELAGFLWYRKPPIDPAFLRRLTGRTQFERFTVQRTPDPGASAPPPSGRAPRARVFAEVEPWLDDRASALARLAKHTVYFAPRLYEGIGMGFLEAMALGLCVVAPDRPTHNEVIAHGVDGLLYPPERPRPLDLGAHREIGRRAREGAARRRALWEAAEGDLLDFLCTPRARLARGRKLVDFFRRLPAACAPSGRLPSITLVTVADGPADALAASRTSVAEQDHPSCEHLVVESSGDSAYAAMAAALAEVESDFVLFLPAGDRLVSPASLRLLFAGTPPAADVVHGHFVVRDAAGVEQLRLVSALGSTLAALDDPGFDPDRVERLPVLAATAFRTELVRRFGFDPELRFTADFDLHRRLAAAGARYRAADAVVASCAADGESARAFVLSAGEWLRLAVRYGGRRGTRRRFVGLGLDAIDAWEQALWGGIDRLRGARRRRYPVGPGGRGARPVAAGERRLAAALRAAALRLAAGERRLRALLPRRRPAPGGAEEEQTYLASFAEGIDFGRDGRPSFVARLSGVSWPEGWGRWSDGPRVEIGFRRALPRRARVELEALAYPDVAGRPVELAIGAATARLAIDGEPFRAYTIDLETSGRESTLVVTIPLSAPPRSAAADAEKERRRLGLALRTLRILDRDNAGGS